MVQKLAKLWLKTIGRVRGLKKYIFVHYRLIKKISINEKKRTKLKLINKQIKGKYFMLHNYIWGDVGTIGFLKAQSYL